MISFRNFAFRYDNLKQPTLKNINLEINEGEKVLIAGPSGSGKSTLAHCINGLIPFTYKGNIQGELFVNGIKPYEKNLYTVSEHVGTILQDQDGQFVALSVGEDVAFAYENNMIEQDKMKAGVNDALIKVDMLEYINESPHNLSGGQKQKIAIAGILATNTPILLFDEPLANLDPASGKRAMETINYIHESTKKTVIIIEHRIEDVLEHDFDRVIIVSEGEIVADAHPDKILAEGIIKKYGLREPLYIEALNNAKVEYNAKDCLSNIKNTLKFKDKVIEAYNSMSKSANSSDKEKVLSIKDISYRYFTDSPDILKNISFDIYNNEVLAILGNNGAGKSTLLKVISGIARPQKGEIIYKNESISKWSIKKRSEKIGYVMQNPNHMLTKNMIYDEVAFGLRNFGYDEEFIKNKVEDTLKICGLHQYRNWPVSSLSYGQKKRVTIASILASEPEILILDEPTAGQDHKNYREFMTFIERIKNEKGISIIMITHDMHLALEYADRAIVLSDGKILAEDSVYKILSNHEVITKADLRATSIVELGKLYDIDDISGFLSYFVYNLKGGGLKHE
jgi:energy-coupling factor transporter ATP-binding protein EcfA2